MLSCGISSGRCRPGDVGGVARIDIRDDSAKFCCMVIPTCADDGKQQFLCTVNIHRITTHQHNTPFCGMHRVIISAFTEFFFQPFGRLVGAAFHYKVIAALLFLNLYPKFCFPRFATFPLLVPPFFIPLYANSVGASASLASCVLATFNLASAVVSGHWATRPRAHRQRTQHAHHLACVF